MNKQHASVLLTLICLVGVGVKAKGQNSREVVVTVPYEFVAAGKTLPAGTYTVSRVSNSQLEGLRISSYENRSSVLVIPNQFEDRPAEQCKVNFNQVGERHSLSSIETLDGVYLLSLPRSATAVAGVTQQVGTTASGSN
jgi:hypothetical protein